MQYTMFAPRVARGDAIGEDVRGIAAALQVHQRELHVFAGENSASDFAVNPVGNLDPGQILPRDALIFHHCFRSDGWRFLLEDRDYCRVLRYHGVTPHGFFRRISPWHAANARIGSRQTAQIVNCGCDVYLPTSEFIRRELIALGVPAERCLTVPPFHRAKRLLSIQPNSGVLSRCCDGRRNLLSVGVLAPHKNQVLLVEAFAALPTDLRRGRRLILVGNENAQLAAWTVRVRTLVAKLGLNDSVVVTGRVGEEELAAYYRVADVYVSASLHEGFGVPLVEAMAFGVPIVALARAAVPETIGEAGLLVKERGCEAFAEAIGNVISDGRLRAGLIAAGHERYQAEFSEPALGNKLLVAIEQIERIAEHRPLRVSEGPLTDGSVVVRSDAYIGTIEPYPDKFHGRGIVICAGGIRYLTCAWVLVNQLRSLGCRLPIQVWQRDSKEHDRRWANLVAPLAVECVDAASLSGVGKLPRGGWELKSFAMLHTPFEEVLLLDADNVPVADPTYLFDEPEYQRLGAIFWPDGTRTPPDAPQWRIFNVAYRDEPEQESGQVLIDKRKRWQALNLCNWYNERSDYFYRVIYGDKDTFRFAWHRLAQPFAMPSRPIEELPATLCQHDLQGQRIFQHRVHDKWSLGGNRRIPGFLHEAECLEFVAELRRRWDVVPALAGRLGARNRQRMRDLADRSFIYERLGSNRWPMQLDPRGHVHAGRTQRELFWWRRGGKLVLAGNDGAPTCELRERADGVWEGMSFCDPKQQCRLRAMATNPPGASAHA